MILEHLCRLYTFLFSFSFLMKMLYGEMSPRSFCHYDWLEAIFYEMRDAYDWLEFFFFKIYYKTKRMDCMSSCYERIWISNSLEMAPIRSPPFFFIKRKRCLCASFCWSGALEFLSTCKLTNLTVKAELGYCLLHRSGRHAWSLVQLVVGDSLPYWRVMVIAFLSLTLGSKEVQKLCLTSGDLALQRVLVIYAQTSLYFCITSAT